MSVGKTTDTYERLEKIRRVPRILMAGTFGLQNDPATYRFVLPPSEGEEKVSKEWKGLSEYQLRIQRATIDPYYERAVDRAVAALFNKPIQLSDDVPVEVTGTESADGLWANIDGRGNNGDEFFRRVAHDSLSEAGMSGVLVEHPKVQEGATLADAVTKSPYLVHYRACDILEAVPDYVNGKERLAYLRLKESSRIDEDGGEHERERVLKAPPADEDGKVQGLVTWELWEQAKPEDDESWEKIKEGVQSPHQEIPFAVYYTGWDGFFRARPPFEQLGYMNLNHTRHYNDIAEDLRISAGAQLFRTVADEDELDQRVISARSLLWGKIGPEGQSPTAQWLERSGSAAQVYFEFLKNLEARMTQLGNEVHMKRQPGNETATGKAIDTAEAKTETEAWSMALGDFIETILGYMAVYLGAENGGSVTVSPPPRFSDRDVSSVDKALEFRREGLLHPESNEDMEMILQVAKEVFNWPEDWSPADAVERAKQRGVLVPGGLETVEDARTRNPLPVMEPPMPPEMGEMPEEDEPAA